MRIDDSEALKACEIIADRCKKYFYKEENGLLCCKRCPFFSKNFAYCIFKDTFDADGNMKELDYHVDNFI